MYSDDQKRAIGKIVSVAADRLVVELHGGTDNFTIVGFDDVHYVARLGSFVMIPVHTEYFVAEIVGIREKDPVLTKTDAIDTLADKATSAKFLDVVPVGMLPQSKSGRFRFGVSVFPSLYSDVLYAVDQELDRIFDVDDSEEPALGPDDRTPPNPKDATRFKAISVGTSVIFQGYDVKVRLEEFFGGHASVLGNTGSGKSCTVASILQSLFEKPREYKARGATIIIFDVNGEYHDALNELESTSDIVVSELILDGTADKRKFVLPHWFLDQSEWELLLQASERTQLPVLRNALGLTSIDGSGNNSELRAHFVATCITECFRGADGDSPVSKIQRVYSLLSKYPTPDLNSTTLSQFQYNEQYGNFPHGQFDRFMNHVRSFILKDVTLPSYSGEPFDFAELAECLHFAILYEEAHGNRQIRDYCSSMMTRLHSLADREEYKFLKLSRSHAITPNQFLSQILGIEKSDEKGSQAQVVILNMNAVEDEVVELVSAVVARMVFKLLRQADPRNRFPVHFVLEEAHRYIPERPSKHAVEAGKIFERVAKEGRKYGVFLLVASQRPCELSRTVLSQCSNFLVHRIQNPEDLSHIRQMTPFISDAVLKRLPSLPKQHALAFGNAVNLPTTFMVRQTNPLPKSHDTQIRDLWFRNSKDKKKLPARQAPEPLPVNSNSSSGARSLRKTTGRSTGTAE